MDVGTKRKRLGVTLEELGNQISQHVEKSSVKRKFFPLICQNRDNFRAYIEQFELADNVKIMWELAEKSPGFYIDEFITIIFFQPEPNGWRHAKSVHILLRGRNRIVWHANHRSGSDLLPDGVDSIKMINEQLKEVFGDNPTKGLEKNILYNI
jgi:hypothetical protein